MEFRGAWEKPEGRPGGIDSLCAFYLSLVLLAFLLLFPGPSGTPSNQLKTRPAPRALHPTSPRGSLWVFYTPPGPPRQREKMASLAVPNSAANIHLEDGRTPESLSSAGFVPFLGHFVAIRM